MPEFLSDPTPTFMIVLGIFVLIAVGFWWSQRSRRSLIVIAAAVGVLGLFLLCDTLFESKREQATQHIEAMIEAMNKRDADAFVSHLSESFTMQKSGAGTAGKEAIRKSHVWGKIEAYDARVAVWDLGHDSYKTINDNEFEIGFMAKGEIPDGGFLQRYVRAFFIKDPDGEYRVKTIKFYDPLNGGMNSESPIPQFP